MEKKCIYLSLGGNQGDSLMILQKALDLLFSKKDTILELKVSRFYRTKPLHCETPHWFVNAACSFLTSLTLQEVFQLTQTIEKQLGKVEKSKNADRPIDIDLLFYGTLVCKEVELEIPHPRWKERLFVLRPLADLTNDIVLHAQGGLVRYEMQALIEPLLDQTHQIVSLLEKNPDFQ